ncbi:hypothetical protein V8F33_005794 [Rhypophila sp. PSN 637]
MADPQTPRLISNVEELTDSDRSMADDLIKELAEKMKYNLVWTPDPVPSERNAFWAQTPKKKPRKLAGGHSRALSGASINARQHFTEVFLKPLVKIDTDTVSFIWSDSIGGIINPYLSRAIQHWDTMEEDRIWTYNSSMCIYWARGRLSQKILREVGRNEEADRIPDSDDFSKLETSHTYAEVLARTAELVKAVQDDLTRTTLNQRRRWLPEYKP